jgi:hypothetical protein
MDPLFLHNLPTTNRIFLTRVSGDRHPRQQYLQVLGTHTENYISTIVVDFKVQTIELEGKIVKSQMVSNVMNAPLFRSFGPTGLV